MTLMPGLPLEAARHGADIDRLILAVHLLMLLLFVGWGIYYVTALVRFRAGRNPRAAVAGGGHGTIRYVEGGILAAEALLLVGFALPVWLRVTAPPPAVLPPDTVELRVVAEQYAWNIHYPGPDRRFGRVAIDQLTTTNTIGLDRADPAAADDIVTINELHLPVNRTVVIRLTSKDVIHSFALPVMRVKQDAIPGYVVPVTFEPIRTGRWEIACAQLCGLGHYRMRGYLTVESDAEFTAWLAQAGSPEAR